MDFKRHKAHFESLFHGHRSYSHSKFLLMADWSLLKQHVPNDVFRDKFHPLKVKVRSLEVFFAEAVGMEAEAVGGIALSHPWS